MTSTIEVNGVSKRYRLGTDQAAYGTLRDTLSGMARNRGQRATRDIWALRDLDLSVDEGEALGVIGRNGAGKSTLLRILARITEPTTGWARTRGRVGALLEVGTGFHGELSGRENVYLSGAIMGMTRRDIHRQFDDIVAFSGIEAFIDTPLKRYSSGMGLRLAFAVAAHLEPEIMLVDEILAVGDLDFQRRCLERMSRLSAEGRTVVFISHDLGAVTRLCARAVQLRDGSVVDEGPATDVVRAYYASVFPRGAVAERDLRGDAGVRRVAIVDGAGDPIPQPQRGDPLHVQLELELTRELPGIDLSVWVQTTDGTRIIDESWSDQPSLPALAVGAGRHTVRLTLPPLLRSGDYVLGVWLGTELHTYVFEDLVTLSLAPRPDDRQEWLTRTRAVHPPVLWSTTPTGEPT